MMEPQIHVRRATPADTPEILRLALDIQAAHVASRPDLFRPGGVETGVEVDARIAGDPHRYWVATIGPQVVGYAYARVVDEPESRWRYASRYLLLDQMGVAAQHRSRGIGGRLWNAVHGSAVADGVDRVILNVWSFNPAAHRFYARLGFTSFHERMAFELAGEPHALAGASDRSERTLPNDFLAIVPGARGHFRLESGHHSDRWLDLDALFADASVVSPWADRLADRLRRHAVAAVCGPFSGGAFLAQLVAARLGASFLFTDRVVPPNAEEMYAVSYPLRPSLAAQARGRRVAIVDDVVSAGSASRATYATLVAAGATPVVVGALLLVGDAARRHFGEIGVAVEAVAEADGMWWAPADCPLCRSGVPLADRTG